MYAKKETRGTRATEGAQVKTHGGAAPVLPEGVKLGPAGSALWEIALKSLPNVLREIDFAALHLCCVCYDIATTAAQHGDNREFFNAMGKFATLAKALGLNPNARGTIKKAENEDKNTDALSVWENV